MLIFPLQCCQQRKNHSSVRAIVSGLRTHAIYRLKKTWQQVSAFHTKLLNMLDHVDAMEKSDRNQEINVSEYTPYDKKYCDIPDSRYM